MVFSGTSSAYVADKLYSALEITVMRYKLTRLNLQLIPASISTSNVCRNHYITHFITFSPLVANHSILIQIKLAKFHPGHPHGPVTAEYRRSPK